MLDESIIRPQVESILAQIRPYLLEDGGDVEFVRFETDSGVVELRLKGNCKECPISVMTLRAGIERYLKQAIPEISRIEAVT